MKIRALFVAVALLAGIACLRVAGAQSIQSIMSLPTLTQPSPSAYVFVDDGNNNLWKATISNLIGASVPSAPSPEPSCVISAGTCSVSFALAGVHECAANVDIGDANGPYMVAGAASPGPPVGWTLKATQATATATPTVHFHPACR